MRQRGVLRLLRVDSYIAVDPNDLKMVAKAISQFKCLQNKTKEARKLKYFPAFFVHNIKQSVSLLTFKNRIPE